MHRTLLTLLFLALPVFASGQPERTITDANIVGDVTFSSDTTYILDGFVYVEDGESLTIEAGTIVKGNPGQAEDASALIVARGGMIHATGDPSDPIIFTAEADDVSDPNDIPHNTRGLWGGVIILGRATVNVAGGENNIEGIPVTEPRGVYGGTDDADNSGEFRYCSIRYGGSNIGANNEINGLTMGAVGSGTTIDHVEVIYNLDDGYEWFGGTVNTKYIISAFCGDDAFDWDEGFRGKGQFWFALQGDDDAGSGGEHDGGTDPEDGMPYAIPVIYNATFIGSGALSVVAGNTPGANFRDNSGGKFYNTIWTEYFGNAITIEDLASGQDSYQRLLDGDLVLQNNLFYDFGVGTDSEDLFLAGGQSGTSPMIAAYMTDPMNGNQINIDPMITGLSRNPDGGLDPTLEPASPARSGAAVPPNDGFYTVTDYIGAFEDVNWLNSWTFLSQGGITDVREITASEVPVWFELDQNYPNPFNPSTRIGFAVDERGPVALMIYNILGQQVATLVDEVLEAGRFEVTFTGNDLPSGVYYYRLSTQAGQLAKKMMLMK